jgi:hypothetical protein
MWCHGGIDFVVKQLRSRAVTSCSFVEAHRPFRRTCCLRHLGRLLPFSYLILSSLFSSFLFPFHLVNSFCIYVSTLFYFLLSSFFSFSSCVLHSFYIPLFFLHFVFISIPSVLCLVFFLNPSIFLSSKGRGEEFDIWRLVHSTVV